MKYVKEIVGDVLLISMAGDLIGENQGAGLMEFVNETINDNIVKCAIDISKLRYINSSGIGVLITMLTKFRNRGGEVFLINPSENVNKLLIITKLNAIFNIADTKEEAIGQLEKV